MEGTLANTIASILSMTSTVMTSLLTWVGNVAQTVVTEPLFALGIGLFLIGAAVSFVVRLIRVA